MYFLKEYLFKCLILYMLSKLDKIVPPVAVACIYDLHMRFVLHQNILSCKCNVVAYLFLIRMEGGRDTRQEQVPIFP